MPPQSFSPKQIVRPHRSNPFGKSSPSHQPHATDTHQDVNKFRLQGKQFVAEGRYPEAIEQFQQLVAIQPDESLAHYYLANACHAAGMAERAIEGYRKALCLNDEIAEAHNNLGIILKSEGNTTAAIAHFRRATEIKPNYFDPHINLGNTLRDQQNFKAAATSYRTALRIQPHDPEAHNYLGKVLRSLGKLDESVTSHERAIELDPQYADAHNNMGLSLQKQNHLDEALASFERALFIQPSSAEAHLNRGNIFKEKGNLDSAFECYQKSLQIQPVNPVAHYNLGNLYADRHDFDDALTCYDQAVAQRPNYPAAHLNRALLWLSTGNFRQGWPEFKWRFPKMLSTNAFHRIPEWDGSPLSNRSILIEAEQGIGDQTMFASCIGEITDQTSHCSIECDSRLVPLFTRSFPTATIRERFIDGNANPTTLLSHRPNLRIAMGDLPRFLRPDINSFPRVRSYLFPDPVSSEKWRSRFTAFGSTFKVGISWQGGGKPDVKRLRSTKLEQWNKILTIPHISFVNLQYGDCNTQITEIRQSLGVDIHDWEDANPLENLDDFAAQISMLDLVISVDNSTAHLAAALGVPVWTLLPFNPDWRWLHNRDDSPWYPTVRLFRQQPSMAGSTKSGDWNSVIAQIANCLQQVCTKTEYGTITSKP